MIGTDGRKVFAVFDLVERPQQFRLQRLERHGERLGSCEDYIIMAWPRRKGLEEPQSLLETAADAVAADRAAGLFCHGEAKPGRAAGALILQRNWTQRRLQSQSARVKALSLRGAQEIRSPS